MAARDEAPDKREETAETPEQRAKRVAQLRKEIAGGTYKVDACKLAAKMVEAHRKRDS